MVHGWKKGESQITYHEYQHLIYLNPENRQVMNFVILLLCKEKWQRRREGRKQN